MKDIYQNVREYIIEDINVSLSRLGISERIEEVGMATERYQLKTGNIRMTPMLFKELYVIGYMTIIEPKEGDRYYEDSEKYHVVLVSLDYRYINFGGGSNSHKLGRIIYYVDRDVRMNSKRLNCYIEKIQGINI